MQPTLFSRRRFLRAATTVAPALALLPDLRAQATEKRYRAAIIGRTGGGDYGHSYDEIFNGLPNVRVEAVADPDPAGRQRAAQRSGAGRQFADYREMLTTVKPELVCIAPRQPDCHRAMALAAIEVCRGLFMEKPFTETVADADAILAAAKARHVPIQVAHSRRYTEEFVNARALLAEGLIGEVRQVEIHGKQDQRAGGEDLIVLGTHDFDLMRFYFGDPRWCQASVTQQGRDLAREDIRTGREPIRVAGTTIHALFAFPRDVMVHWGSVTRGDGWNNGGDREKWAFEILGTKGVLAWQAATGVMWLDSPFLAHREAPPAWKPAPPARNLTWPAHARNPIRSLIRAIESGEAPVCSGEDGRWAIEMVAAVYEAERSRGRVALPLADRSDPLARF